MDRFERNHLDAAMMQDVHLHSNMDRFERPIKIKGFLSLIDIYIPIWIDLKAIRIFAVIPLQFQFTFQYG